MELIRKRLIVETEYFLNFYKSTKIRFPWVVGPFIIKNNDSLSMIENFLKNMGFLTEAAINYDPLSHYLNQKTCSKNKAL